MKVIFLDFDGVINSQGSFVYEDRRRKEWKEQGVKGRVNETLCNICTSNFQLILDQYPEAKVVISSTWREIYDLEWLKEKLASYHVDSSRVIGITPKDNITLSRGKEIADWLRGNPDVTHYIIIDDNDWGITDFHDEKQFVNTTWDAGLTFDKAMEAIKKFKTPKKEKTTEEEDESTT